MSVMLKSALRTLPVALLCAAILPATAQPPKRATIMDEAQVAPYTLPDPLVCEDGSPVLDAQTWREKRRPEILRLCENEWFGKTPIGKPKAMRFVVREEKKDARGGKATRLRVALLYTGKEDGPQTELLIYLPNHVKGKVPIILALSFDGNFATTEEADIPLPHHWVNGLGIQLKEHLPAESMRGSNSHSWPYDYALEHGFGVATAGYGDVEPDYPGGDKLGYRSAIKAFQNGGGSRMGTVGAWAWSLSRCVDYLGTNPRVDAKKIAIQGHSRLGKAALWAAAQDERIALVISNESGAGGAALNKRIFGETVGDLARRFPHWFCPNFAKYSENEDAMPVDSHELISLIAPRPVLITSAVEDRWSDPKGEFLAAVAADPVYRLLGGDGVGSTQWPEAPGFVPGKIGYWIRQGKHDVLLEDWKTYIAFAESHFRSKR